MSQHKESTFGVGAEPGALDGPARTRWRSVLGRWRTAYQTEPTVGAMLKLWVPLAASLVMMVLEPALVNIGLARAVDPELSLAAYGVAFSLALLVEAPIIMLLDASVAQSSHQQALALVMRFTLALGVAVVALGLVVSLTPLYTLLVVELMNIPSDIADRVRPALQVLSFWPLPIAWRRAQQGVLIRTNRTNVITAATGVRLATLATGLFIGLRLEPERGALAAAWAMNISVTVEAGVVTWAARRIAQRDLAQGPAGDEAPLTIVALARFYGPLAVTTILRQASRPLTNAGIAATLLARESLATWPVVWGVAILITGPAWSLQQLSIALSTSPPAFRRVSRFSMVLSAIMAALLATVAFVPSLYTWVMGGIYNLSPALQTLGRPALRWLVLMPLLMGTQSLLRGAFIRGGCTGTVRTAMVFNVSSLALALLIGVQLLHLPGTTLAAFATLAGGAAELVYLWRQAYR
jgi:Na+-driven multidrug efflux pump